MDNRLKRTTTWFDPSDRRGMTAALPPLPPNKRLRGNMTRNRRSPGGAILHAKTKNDTKFQLHRIEQKAYSDVLLALSARSNTFTWAQDSLLAELRTVLRMTDEEHKELLSTVNSDAILPKIRESRHAAGLQSDSFKHDRPELPRPITAVLAKQKSNKSASLSLEAPLPSIGSVPLSTPSQPFSSDAKRAAVTGAIDKKIKSISPEDMRWNCEEPVIHPHTNRDAQELGDKKRHGGGALSEGETGTTTFKNKSKKDLSLSQNDISKKRKGDDIEIPHSEALLVELDKIFSVSHHDPRDSKKAKRLLEQWEQSLIVAIETLDRFSDGESD